MLQRMVLSILHVRACFRVGLVPLARVAGQVRGSHAPLPHTLTPLLTHAPVEWPTPQQLEEVHGICNILERPSLTLSKQYLPTLRLDKAR